MFDHDCLTIEIFYIQLVKKKVRVERPMERCVKDIFYPMGILMTDLTRPSQHFSTHGIGNIVNL